MTTVAQYLNTLIVSQGFVAGDLQTVERWDQTRGMWHRIGASDFIDAASRVDHPTTGNSVYRLTFGDSEGKKMTGLYNGTSAERVDERAIRSITPNQLDGTDPFP